MNVTFRKSILAWMKNYVHYPMCWFGWFFIHYLYLNPEKLTPGYASTFSLVYFSFTIASIFGFLRFFKWLVKDPKEIVIDLSTGKVRDSNGGSIFHSKNNFDVTLATYSYENILWYGFYFECSMGKFYSVPKGYCSDISYLDVAKSLESMGRAVSIHHLPWLFKEKQREEDASFNERSLALKNKTSSLK